MNTKTKIKLRRRLATIRDESGFTVVEGAVAALLLVTGAIGTLQLFDTATRNAYRTEESQSLNNRLQAELEEVKSLPFSEIALSAAPSGSADQNDPRWRVSGANYAVASNGTNLEPMVVDAANGAISPAPEPFQVGDVSGDIYKFVVWRDDPSCPQTLCPGDEDLKRVIVAAKVDEAAISFERSFQEVHTDLADPEAVPIDPENPLPGGPGDPGDPCYPNCGEEEENAVGEFWLTDTPCNLSVRQEIVADHAAHNTRSRCSDGMQTGATQGAPDLMFNEAPELDPDFPPDGQPLFDYATDSEPATGGDQDKGLLMPWSSTDSCLLQPVLSLLDLHKLIEGTLLGVPIGTQGTDGILNLVTGESNKHMRAHTWLSAPVENTGGVVMSGNATLELWTKSVNEAVHPGRICVTLFVRQQITVPILNILGIPIGSVNLTVDLPVVNTDNVLQPTYFEYSQNPWPTQWTEVSVPMEFMAVDSTGALEPLHLAEGSQLGMTIMVKKTGTEPGSALEFMYDHPSFESRLQVESEEVISF